MAERSIDEFRARRAADNERVLATDHLGVKRFFNLDTAAYRDATDKGGLPAATKELLGLVASLTLRCNDCVDYHMERCVDAGFAASEIEDALHIGLIVGGSIVIPHLRHAYRSLDALVEARGEAPESP